mgnify:CR=1 FL=1
MTRDKTGAPPAIALVQSCTCTNLAISTCDHEEAAEQSNVVGRKPQVGRWHNLVILK